MYSAPSREGRQSLLQTSTLLPRQQVTGWDHQAVGAGAEPPLDKQVQVGEVSHHFQTGLWDEKMDTVAAPAAARLSEISWSQGNDDHPSIAKVQDDPLEICDRGSQRHLVDDHDLPDHVEGAVLLLAYCGELPVRVGAAETGIIQTINHDWRLSWEAGAIGGHLRQDLGDSIGSEDPPACDDSLHYDPEGGNVVGEPVGVAGADDQGRHTVGGPHRGLVKQESNFGQRGEKDME